MSEGHWSISVTDRAMRNFGRQFAWGVAEVIALAIAGAIILSLVIEASGSVPTDDTDKGPLERSGLQPLTDARTGCQYLRTSSGSLTPRLDRSGKPICGVSS